MPIRGVLPTITASVLAATACYGPAEDAGSQIEGATAAATLTGRWMRQGPSGWLTLELGEDGRAEADVDGDSRADVESTYRVEDDRIRFEDTAGRSCPEAGTYLLDRTDYYLALSLAEDDCPGRVQFTLGFWVDERRDFLLELLSSRIAQDPDPSDLLARGRMYLALGDGLRARADLDAYIATDSTYARVYLNRAATRFPGDLEGVVADMNRAIALEPDQMMSYFLRALARYDLGEEEEACADFRHAIGLGFSVLEQAEATRCSAYWAR